MLKTKKYKTLLQKANAARLRRNTSRCTDEELELIVAFFKREISSGQVAVANGMDKAGANGMNWLTGRIRAAVYWGQLEVTIKEEQKDG